ncbi:hypothetical protein JCM19294_1115 [Nonlabens tegetincola]|uniref:Uncharacterized protein n=1 Tax=Nonlabens tegetincola TaxID=323273 RepID=A0A090QMP2_9FLAO|nr:hypothetical protein [Nonlabens tegetincola]GAK96806.1 hypothetical protein JCM19294_1115 [Nonlabens tegetincola]
MIDLLQAPLQDSLLWDANNSLIKLKSYRNNTHYFRAVISINDLPFITQNWSKDAAGVAVQDLQKLYYNYFNPSFSPISSGAPSITHLDYLKKKVSIEIQECLIGTTTVEESITLPDYHICFTERSNDIEMQDNLILLSDVNEIKVFGASKIRIPFYCVQGDFTVEIANSQDDVLNSTINHTAIENGIYQLDIDLNNLNTQIPSSGDEVVVTISQGTSRITYTAILTNRSLYSTKTIYYRNSYGVYQIAYLFGQQKIENQLEKDTYINNNQSPITHYVDDMEITELSSGHGHLSLSKLMLDISRSLDVKLLIDNNWTTVHCSTDKTLTQVERQYVYQEVLTFERNSFGQFETGQYIPIPDILDLNYTIDENNILIIPLSDFTTAANGFVYDRIRINQPSVNARYGYNNSTSTVFTNDPLFNNNFIPEAYLVSEINEVIYFPQPNAVGSPLDSLLFQLGNGTIWSNPASLTVVVNDLNPGNQAPIIQISRTSRQVVLNQNGDATLDLNTVITDPDGDPVTILWEALNNAPITFSPNNAASTQVTLTGAAIDTTYQVKVTATDNNSNVSTLIVDIRTLNFIIYSRLETNIAESSGSVTVYDLIIGNLPQGESIEVVSEAATTFNTQAFRIDYLTAKERTASSYQRLVRTTHTNTTGAQEFTVKIAFDNISSSNDAKLFVRLDNPSIGFIEEFNEKEINPAKP